MTKFHLHKILLPTLLFVLLISTNAYTQCSISDLVITNSACDENDNFSIELTFNFNDTGANGFQVLGNGNNYGTFQYADLPITIEGLSGNCELDYEFIVRDVIDPTCAAFLEYGTVCCDDICSISILDFETTECENNVSFGINLNLEYEFVGQNGYSVTINGDSYGEYSYEELPLSIDNILTVEEGNNKITICDNDFSDCCASQTFLNPCVCGMTNITSNIVECNMTDSTYYVIIDFDHVATNDSFQMGYSNNGTNVFLGIYAYIDLPVTVGPIYLSENEQEIVIIDTDDFFCFSAAYLGVVDDCDIECQLSGVFAEAYMCEEGVYFMDVEFDAEDIEGSTFDILVDGISYGTFAYGENTYTVGPIPSDCDLAPTVVVQDTGQELCSDFFNLSEPVCCPADCNFTSFEVETICNPSDLTVNGAFENNGASLSGFYFVELLGTSYGPFPYNDFMFSITVPLLQNGEYTITINDSLDPNCQISTNFETQCDDELCMIFNVFAEASECDENLFFADVEFDYGGSVSDSFNIGGNGVIYGTFPYGEQFYTVGPLEGDCETIFDFFVSDQIMEGCNSFYAFEEAICCEVEECNISNLEITEFECMDALNISNFTLNFSHSNTPSDQFTILIDGLESGTYSYSDLPITIEIFTSGNFNLSVHDLEDPNCEAMQDFDLKCCTITDTNTEFIECDDDDSYFASLSFNHSNTSDSFLLLNGAEIETFSYADLPITIGPNLLGISHIYTIVDLEHNCGATEIFIFEVCDTGLEEADFSNVKITQHSNSLSIVNTESELLEFNLFSSTGAHIEKMIINSNRTNSIKTGSLPQGLYLLNMANGLYQRTVKIIIY